jgi:glycosyltransferase involved in cell wall biosynthesis
MDKLSVAIITYNEGKNIRRCLESVSAVADEIVVVDSFSTDDTRLICEDFGVKFSTNPFEGHIQQKNHALTLCSHKHVLSLDADEALSKKLLDSILSEKAKGFKDAYCMNRLTNYCGKWIHFGGWYPDRKVRLVHKDKARWGGINPHDKLIPDKTVKPCRLKGDILHYSINSLDEHKKVVANFSGISAKALHDRGVKTSLSMVYLSPTFKFVQSYFFQLGFLEGVRGWHIARLSAKAKYLKYKKLRKLNLAKAAENTH